MKVLLVRVDESRVEVDVACPRGPAFDVRVGERAVGVDLFSSPTPVGRNYVTCRFCLKRRCADDSRSIRGCCGIFEIIGHRVETQDVARHGGAAYLDSSKPRAPCSACPIADNEVVLHIISRGAHLEAALKVPTDGGEPLSFSADGGGIGAVGVDFAHAGRWVDAGSSN